jgi:hypothetical protein
MSDDESNLADLDELSQDYEESRPAKKKAKGKRKAKPGEYSISGALTAPRATTYSTEALCGECRPINTATSSFHPAILNLS